MNQPLMPKATAVWLIDKTALTFDQIADFVGMHPLEIQAIADGEVAQGIIGYDPITNGQLTREEIQRCEADSEARLQMARQVSHLPKSKAKGGRYTPVSKRNDRPDAIAWLLRNFPQVPEATIVKLLGTTKETIAKVRDRTHWNSANIKPRDPVILGLCTQGELNAAVGALFARRANLMPPSAHSPRLKHRPQKVLRPEAEHFQAKWKRLAARKMRPGKCLVRLP